MAQKHQETEHQKELGDQIEKLKTQFRHLEWDMANMCMCCEHLLATTGIVMGAVDMTDWTDAWGG